VLDAPNAALTKVPLKEATMAALDVTKKLHIYHTLYRLNLSFSAIVARCRTLQETGLFKAKDMRLYQGLTQELQCEINERLLDTLHDIEFDDWTRFGEIRKAQEKDLRDPSDVLIKAKEYKQSKLRRPKRKTRTQTRD
jgi:hypothetical protein